MSDPSPMSRKVRVLLAERNRRHCLGAPSDASQSQGLIASLVTKIVNNLQVTVRNIHVRYEDKLSVPGVSECQTLFFVRGPRVVNSVYSIPSLPV